MQPSENWGPTHRNLERLQRRSISSANQTSRKNSSVRRDPTTTTANTGTTTSASSSLKLNQSSQQQQQQHQQQQIAQQNNPHSLPFPPPHSILHSARQSNGGTLGAHNGAQGGHARAHANPNLISGSGKTVSIQNGGPTAIISSSGKSVGHLSKAKANRPSPLTMVPPTAATNLPHPPFHPPLGARTSGNGNGGDCSSSSSELTTVTPTNLSVKSGGHVVILDGGGGGGGGGGGNGGSGGHTPKLPQSQFTTATTGLRSSGQGGDTSTPSSSLPSSANPVNSRNRSFDNPFFDGSVQGYRGQQQQLHQGVSRSNSDANKETRI